MASTESKTPFSPAEAGAERLLKIEQSEFCAIMLSYNVPRAEARELAAQQIALVREYHRKSGQPVRRLAFRQRESC
jgi:hypothetical protein